MSEEEIIRKAQTKNMIHKVMRECVRKEKTARNNARALIAVVLVGVLFGGMYIAKDIRVAKAEEARLRKTGAIVDRILVYDMDGNLIEY